MGVEVASESYNYFIYTDVSLSLSIAHRTLGSLGGYPPRDAETRNNAFSRRVSSFQSASFVPLSSPLRAPSLRPAPPHTQPTQFSP